MKRILSMLVAVVMAMTCFVNSAVVSAFYVEIISAAQSEEDCFPNQDSDVIISLDQEYDIYATAQEYTEDCFTYTVSDAGATITKYTGTASELTVPEALGGYTVTAIDRYAFQNCTSLVSVKLPDSVTTIGYSAFRNCTNLESINYPMSWSTVDNPSYFYGEIFAGCTKLTKIVIPEGVTAIPEHALRGADYLVDVTLPSTLISIGGSAFEGCASITEITIHDGLLTVGRYAFQNCTSLVSVKLPDSVKTIGYRAFRNCTNLESINYPMNWSTVDNPSYFYGEVFAGCTKLTKIVIPEGVTAIPADAFRGANGLVDVSLPSSLITIGESAFMNCVGISKIIIPDNVTSTGKAAFSGCISLSDITLPNVLLTVGQNAFENCTSLVSVKIPDSVTTIGYRAFYNCSNLESINYPMSWSTVSNRSFYYGEIFTGCTKLTSIVIPEGVTAIPADAFRGANGLVDVSLPSSLITIGESAFMNCVGISKIIIPDNVTSTGKAAFSGCISLSDITLPNVLLTVGQNAFENCTSLVSVKIPDSVTTIGYRAFYNCSNLESINYPMSWSTVSNRSFYYGEIFTGCTKLTSIVIPEGVTAIPADAFRGANGLVDVSLPSSLITIGESAFMNCVGISKIIIPDNVTSTGKAAFSGCISLSDITLPNVLLTVGQNAFENCTSLVSVKIPDSVTTIGYRAFYNCSNLESINYPMSWSTVSNLSFYYGEIFTGCTKLTSIVIPEGVTAIPEHAFRGADCLVAISLPSTLIEIKDYAFSRCTSLIHVTVPDEVTTIGNYAFSGCTLLERIWIGENVTKIGTNAFSNCSALTIHGVAGSYVETYANANSIPFSTKTFDAIFVTLSGKVIDGFGNGVQRVCVYIYNADRAQYEYNVTYTDINGNWSIDDATRGDTYVIRFYKEGYEFGNNDIICTAEDDETTVDAVIARAIAAGELVLSAEVEYKKARLSWSYSGDINLIKRFYVYTSDAFDGTYSLITSVANDTTEYTVSLSNKTVYFKIEAVDVLENLIVSPVIEVAPEINDFEDPVAVIYPESLLTAAGVEFSFNGASSTDNEGITSYSWDFGDGVKVDGAIAAHTYMIPGSYTVTLTVSDAAGNTDTAAAVMTVVDVTSENATHVIVDLRVVDASIETLPAISGATLYFHSNNEQTPDTSAFSDKNGNVSVILAKDVYAVSAAANGYMPSTKTLDLTNISESTVEYTFGLSKTSLVSGQITAKEMTYEEIIDAGIDVTDPENSHVVRFEVVLEFVGAFEIYDIPVILGYKKENGEFIPGESRWLRPRELGEAWEGKSVGLFPINEKFLLVIYGEAHWLKEMYAVELIVFNESYVDTIEDCIAELELPDGLSLAAMVDGAQSSAYSVGTIPSNSNVSVKWYVRGDKEGDYYISANVTANLVSGNLKELITESYTTAEPIHVYAGSALKMTITADDIAKRGEDYPVKFRIENVSDKSLYNFMFGITGVEQYKVLEVWSNKGIIEIDRTLIQRDYFNEEFKVPVKELAPGGYVEIEMSTTIWFKSSLELIEYTDVGAFVDIAYYLTGVSVATLEGSTTSIPYEIVVNRTERESILNKILFDLANEIFGIEDLLGYDPSGSLGDTLIEVIGDGLEIDVPLLRFAKTYLKMRKGQTDYKVSISVNDGLGTENSIYNDYIQITSGTDAEAVVDTLNGNRLTVEWGEVSFEGRAPGTARVELKVQSTVSDDEVEMTLNIHVEDRDIDAKISVSDGSAEISGRIDEDTFKETVDKIREQQLKETKNNPFEWYNSAIVIDSTSKTDDSSIYAIINADSLEDMLKRSVTTHLSFEGKAANMSFERNVVAEMIADKSGEDITFAAKRLTDEEAKELGSTCPTYEFTVMSGGEEISEFKNGKVYISLPYELKIGMTVEEISVQHLNDDGTFELIPFEYNRETGCIEFETDSFSFYRIYTDDIPRGDINGDGKVDVQDGVLMQRILAKLETKAEYLMRADLNTDGKIDVQDGVKMQRILAHLE